ncbi:SusC/RagA family TonB-linked outer membrane protein [Chishuiella changwenlii]|uniref:SusC/RagA family TonB-linked outer membrane protein n=1 Tax=Chishuiella changwenlii TaxID=1434701 RepID=UPI002FD88F02
MRKNFIVVGLLLATLSVNAQEKDPIKNDTVNLAESVIVTSSYGTTSKRKDVVGSLTQLTEEDIITSQPFESIEKMIAGLDPGVQIVNNTDIGKPVDINIRGLGTIVGVNGLPGTSTQPLIIIDGVYMREDKASNIAFFNGGVNAEMNINPLARLSTDNVQSITILKDAAAVSLYGADAANGVILITTKKGRKSKPKFTYSSQYGISTSINKIKYLSGEQHTQVVNTYGNKNDPWNGVDVNWFDVMNRESDYFKTNFGVSGGTDHFTYRFGVDYSKNNESKIFNYLEKKGIDLNLGYHTKKFRVNLSAAYNNFYKNNPNTYFSFVLAPTIPIYDENGEFNKTGTRGITNPLAAATQNKVYTENNSLLSSLNAEYQVTNDIKISSVFGIDYSKKNNVSWQTPMNESASNVGGRSRINKSDGTNWNWSVHALYNKDFGKHHIDGLLGLEVRSAKDYKENFTGSGFTGSNYPNVIDYIIQPWQATNYAYRESTTEQNGRSTFAQINYNYDSRYFFTGSIRRDESSSFGSDKGITPNGGLGFAWMISNEDFLKHSTILKVLKLRASWGMTGNSRIGTYRSSGLYNVYQNGFIYDYFYSYPDSSSPPNKNLGWEKDEKFNIGLDINLLNRVDITVDLYRNNKSSIITSSPVPLETGYTSAEINATSMYNKGIEASIRIHWLKDKKSRWTTSFNIGTVQNKVTEILGFGDQYSVASLARANRVGAPTSAIWGYEWVGINPETGLDRYNVNGEILDSNQFSPSADKTKIIGNTQPDAIGGFMNSIQIGNFTFNALFNFQIGGDILINGELIDKYNISGNRNMSVNALDYWTGPGDTNALNAKPASKAPIANSSKYVYDNTHIKLQNVSFSYQLPIKKDTSFIDAASIFMDVSNVLYWYKEKSPHDRNGVREFKYLYPEMRTYSMGFRVNF